MDVFCISFLLAGLPCDVRQVPEKQHLKKFQRWKKRFLSKAPKRMFAFQPMWDERRAPFLPVFIFYFKSMAYFASLFQFYP